MASSSSSIDEEGLQQLIPIINKLQDVFNTLGSDTPLDLPQICVVGSQSSGKSSVLEHIVGRDFLPRGSGIVTRRPLVLQLTQIRSSTKHVARRANEENPDEWGEFLHQPGIKYHDFSKIRDEIARETDRVTGKNKGISSQPINLKVYSPHVLNLTLVDLPGMTRVPVGDQPLDIERQIRNMIYQYARQPNALILAVTPANADLATSDAIQLAREVDPDGSRTLGVLTKLDIMDRGTDALDILNNQVVPLKLGFVGIVNRCQEDIAANMSIRDALQKEQKFFSDHPVYRRIASRCGTAYLSRNLNKRLLGHIRATLPDLKTKLSLLTAETQSEMNSYGDPLLEDQQGALLLQIITKFARDYGDVIDGKNSDLSIHELFGGARINYIFNEIFGKCLDSFDPLQGLTNNDIRTAIRNATGPRTALFIPEDAFEVLVKRQIQNLEEPSLQCVGFVFDELQRIVNQIEAKEIARFKTLRDRVVEVMNGLLNKCRAPTKKMISDLIQMELSYINTSHPDFVGGSGAIHAILASAEAEQQAQQQLYAQQIQRENEAAAAPVVSTPTPAPTPAPTPVAMPPTRPVSQPNPSRPSQPPPTDNKGSFFNMFFGPEKSPQASPNAQPPRTAMSTAVQPSRVPPSAAPMTMASSPSSSAASSSSMAPSMAPPMSSRSGYGSRPERMEEVPSTIKTQSSATNREMFETQLIQNLMLSYFDIVRKNIKDLVPKSCMHFLVNSSRRQCQSELITTLYKPDMFDQLLEESPEVAEKRRLCAQRLETLRRANYVLNEVRDLSVSGGY